MGVCIRLSQNLKLIVMSKVHIRGINDLGMVANLKEK